MGEDSSSEFRAAVRQVVRRHDPSAEALRSLADDLDELADRYDRQDQIL